MEFSLTFEQSSLKDGVARFVAKAHDFETAQRLKANGCFSREHWKQFAELGWLAMLISDENGGLGGTLVDSSLVMEEFGRGLLGAPYVSTAVVAALLLDQAEQSALQRELVGKLVEGDAVIALAVNEANSRYENSVVATSVRREGDGFRLSGKKILSIDGGVADGFIVSARIEGDGASDDLALFYVAADAAGVERHAYTTIDARTAADLLMKDVKLGAAALLAAPPDATRRLSRALDAARLMFAAEAIGMMEAAIEATIDYLRTRKQFGHALSSYQVLTHRVAEMLVKKDHARSMVYRGLSRMNAPEAERAAYVSATMVAIIESGEFVGGQAIQLHGGIGMTEECAVGHYYKRFRAIGKIYGDMCWHTERFAELSEQVEKWAAA